jgi:hypothetical protein
MERPNAGISFSSPGFLVQWSIASSHRAIDLTSEPEVVLQSRTYAHGPALLPTASFRGSRSTPSVLFVALNRVLMQCPSRRVQSRRRAATNA